MDLEKHGINIGLNNMCDFRQLRFKKSILNVVCCLKVHRYLTTFFRLKIVLLITQLVNGSPEDIKSGLCFSNFVNHKKQNLRFYPSNIACPQY